MPVVNSRAPLPAAIFSNKAVPTHAQGTKLKYGGGGPRLFCRDRQQNNDTVRKPKVGHTRKVLCPEQQHYENQFIMLYECSYAALPVRAVGLVAVTLSPTNARGRSRSRLA